MSKYTPFNLNNRVRVRLKGKGYQHMADSHNKSRSLVEALGFRTAQHYADKADSEGYTTLPAWEFMNIFGETMGIGFNLCFDPTIEIEVS